MTNLDLAASSRFRFALTRFYLVAEDPLVFPAGENLGGLLRDRFGSALKHSVCPFPHTICKTGCACPEPCAYDVLFEPRRERSSLSQGREARRPYVFEPPLRLPATVTVGEVMPFNLLLIGTGIDYYPFFVAAVDRMARQGIGYMTEGPQRHGFGQKAARWTLQRVEQVRYSGQEQPGVLLADGSRIIAPPKAQTLADVVMEAERLKDDFVDIVLISPVQIKVNGRILKELSADLLIDAIFKRWGGLSEDCCGEVLPLDKQPFVDHARDKVQCVPVSARWDEWQRHSAEQRVTISQGGLVGAYALSGDIAPIAPLLVLGEHIHIGRATVVGLGKYACG